MKFLKIVEEIQNKKENSDYLILIHCGIFFYGIGKDAVLLREHFGLNNICISNKICKCVIPVSKIDKFIQKLISRKIYRYMLNLLIKLPRTEKFSIGNEYKISMYEMLKNVMYIVKIDENKRLYYIDKIDVDLNCQRIFLRLMVKNRWIDEKKFKIAMSLISEIGKLVGGLIKYYGKKNKKSV